MASRGQILNGREVADQLIGNVADAVANHRDQGGGQGAGSGRAHRAAS